MFTMNHESDAEMDHQWLHTPWRRTSRSCEQMDNVCKDVTPSLCDIHWVDLFIKNGVRNFKATFG